MFKYSIKSINRYFLRKCRIFCRFSIALLLLLSFFVCLGVSSPKNHSNNSSAKKNISTLIEKRINEVVSSPKTNIRGEQILARNLLVDFYRKRHYRPAWISIEGPLKRVHALISVISTVDKDGLTPEYYHLSTIQSLISSFHSYQEKASLSAIEMLIDLELLLSDAYLLLGCHFSAGCVNPITMEAEWFIPRDNLNITSVFEKAIKDDTIDQSLLKLLPQQDEYTQLKKHHARYKEIHLKGGWPIIPEGRSLKKGESNYRVSLLRKRLIIEGYPIINSGNPENLFDDVLEEAVVQFQRLHGLKTDGIVGFYTLSDLNVSANDRARQIELNMERLRWISGNLGKNYIKVNIADFTLDVVESEKNVLHMKVVVGKPFWHTPVFSEKIRYLVLNPHWNVPRSIATSEIIPHLQRDPDYLSKHNMKVLKGWGETEEEINSSSIDWDTMNQSTFKYRFRQEPGAQNPLGSIKFMFPNKFGVYLHDTQSKSLFDRNIRSFSHGCIRIEKPIELAEYLLKKDPKWSRARIVTEIRKGLTKQVQLPEPVTIHILYLTAWVDAEGFLNFRNDIYERDKKLDEALRKRPPSQ